MKYLVLLMLLISSDIFASDFKYENLQKEIKDVCTLVQISNTECTIIANASSNLYYPDLQVTVRNILLYKLVKNKGVANENLL